MNTKHTPGPWIFALDFDSEGNRPCITTVAKCCEFVIGLDSTPYRGGNYRDGDPSGNSEDDARLIAAAPDLLESLLELVNEVQPLGIGRPTYQKALTVIAKATGESA